MNNHFFTALRGAHAFERFLSINKNALNAYHSGYEHYMDNVPIIKSDDCEEIKNGKLQTTSDQITLLAKELLTQSWIYRDWPSNGIMLTRAILAIDKETNAQIALVRWNQIETPIHGHQYGQMLDMLLAGTAAEQDYDIIDSVNRVVKDNGHYQRAIGPKILSNGYYSPLEAIKGAMVHKFIPLSKCITLHFIPEMPPDGKGNLFQEAKNFINLPKNVTHED